MKSLSQFIIEQQLKNNSVENLEKLSNDIKSLGELFYKNKNHGKHSWGRGSEKDKKLYNETKKLVEQIKSDIENGDVQKYNLTKTNYNKCFPKRRRYPDEYYIFFEESTYKDSIFYDIWVISGSMIKGKNLSADFRENDEETVKINSLKRANLFTFKSRDYVETHKGFIVPVDEDTFNGLYDDIKEIEENK